MGCIQMVITSDVVTKNMHMSMRWKAESVAYEIRIQPSPRFTSPVPLKPDCSPVHSVCLESVQHLILSSKSYSFQTVHHNKPHE
jgi:hypothetical protein